MTSATVATTTHAAPSIDARRAGGAAGLFFAVSVIVQNVIRGAAAPQGEVTAADLVAYAETGSAVTSVVTALFILNVPALVLFVAVLAREAWAHRPALSLAGVFGAAGVFAVFVVTASLDLVVVREGADLAPELLTTIWAVHDALFVMILPILGMTLLALGLAGVSAGLTPSAFRWLAPLGFAIMVLSAVAFALTGSPVAVFPGLLGFLIWLGFTLTTGARMVRPA